ncbi:MAG TPA: heparan-alpha-glucosaminide N-acetyltransferase domain-containing protein [Myxococcaceae bacterium]|nr:heparan-alpha-glucosaminide N-acetyltransferase domain-containing protein [Myxococcaceae bacterium]
MPSPPQPSAQARVRAFDWLRGLAVLVMIETHAMVLLRKELLATPAAGVLDRVNGLVAPSFIFAAGFSLALVQVRAASAGGARAARVLRSLRRIGEVLAVGTLINWIWFPISIEPGWLLRMDILQCIGVTLLAALPLDVALAPRPRRLVVVSLLVAVALFFVSPFADGVTGPFQDLFNKSGPRHSVFPLFPWAGWAFLGGAAGATAARGTAAEVRRLAVGIGLGSAAAWFLKPLWLGVYPPHAFWVTDPANSGARGIAVMSVLLFLLAIEARAPAGARRSPAVWLLELFGTSSLAAYFWHEMLIYYEVRGVSLARIAGGRCGWAGFAGLTLLVIAATALLSWITDRIYRRLDRRSAPRPVPAVGPVSA